MPLFIPIAIGGVVLVTGGFGAKKGLNGVGSLKRAKQIARRAETSHAQMHRRLGAANDDLSVRFEKYNKQRQELRETTFSELKELLDMLHQRGRMSGLDPFTVGDVKAQQLPAFVKTSLQVSKLGGGIVTAAAAGTAAASATTAAVGGFATASTGAAISGLSGAAAQSASLAWLGGGALSVGGGGMALGATVLTGVTAAPVLAVGGMVLAAQGAKALTRAEAFSAQAAEKIAKMQTAITFSRLAGCRVSELGKAAKRLDKYALRSVRKIRARVDAFDPGCDSDVREFQHTMLLCRALYGLLKVPVLSSKGELSEEVAVALETANSALGES